MPDAPTYIIGHKNPDADSICAAIAYSDFKRRHGNERCIAARCGNSNARIDVILDRFGVQLPLFLGDVTPRIRDIMVREVIKIHRGATCAEALELIDTHDIRILPVIDSENRLDGTVSIFQLGEYFIPKIREPKEMRRVHATSVNSIIRSLKARVLHSVNEERSEDLFVRIGAMDIRSFGRFSETEAIAPDKSVIVVGDRRDIQEHSIRMGVRLLVITGGLDLEEDIVRMARDRGTSLIVSPYDSATTAWSIRCASTLDRLVEKDSPRFSPDQSLRDIKKRITAHNAAAFIVTDDTGGLLGIFTKTDILKPVQTRLILVDHNELTQAVTGAAEVNIVEIVDHHRLGNLHTNQPILFLNEPVGSTCTIIADLYRREGLDPSREIAGIMMSGIISDTLNLNSPTATAKDRSLLKWLSTLAGIESDDLADIIFSSGSVILSHSPSEVIRSDYKIYEETGRRFSVSQVEELGFGNFREKSDALLVALEDLKKEEKLHFSALLVTDINTQNSLLLIRGDPDFIQRIPFPAHEKGESFELHGVVSRKKQLIPFLIGLMQSIPELEEKTGGL